MFAISVAATGMAAPMAVQAQQEAVSPYAFTCAQMLEAQPGDERMRANMMVYWSVGYMYGRLGGPDAPLQEANYQDVVNDMIGVFQQICPNVPDLSIAAFAENLAADFERSVQE